MTEFVCGSCWNSFAREEGVISSDNRVIACPHCRHENPLDDDDGPVDVTSKVAAAPASTSIAFGGREDSQTFGTRASAPRPKVASLNVTAPGAVVAPTAVAAPTIAQPRRQTGRHKTEAYRSDAAEPLNAVTVASEATNPVAAPPAPADDVEAGPSFDDMFAPTASLASLTPEQVAQARETAAVLVRPDEKASSTDDLEADLGTAPATEAIAPIELAEPDEWKLKAPTGLTYNFHSLDAMMGWAATKSGSEMNVSADGETWYEFSVFSENVRSGLTGAQTLAVLGGSVASTEELRFFGQESGAMQVRSAMDDIAAVDAREAAELRLNLQVPDYDGAGGVTLVADEPGKPITAADDLEAALAEASGRPAPETAALPPGRVSGANRAADAPVGGARRTTRNRKAEPPKTSKGKGGKAAKSPPSPNREAGKGSGSSALIIVAAVIAVAVVGAIALHFAGIVVIPGLP